MDLMESTKKSRIEVTNALKACNWDPTQAFTILMGEEISAPSTVYSYQIKKWQEKEAFKLIEENITRSGKISVKKMEKRGKQEKKNEIKSENNLSQFMN
jgi:hypothetical protein